VIDESDGEILYTLRTSGASYRPRVFKEGSYTIKVGEPGTARMKVLRGISSMPGDTSKTIRVEF
jgi:hypothetical protein